MHKEINFEDAIEAVLITEGGYTKGNPNDYDADRALFPKDILAFVQQTQPKFWERFAQINQGKAAEILLDSLVKELQSKGMLTVLRSGFKCFGKTVRLAYFAPNTGMDPDAFTRYRQNRLTVTRQRSTAQILSFRKNQRRGDRPEGRRSLSLVWTKRSGDGSGRR